MSFQPDTHRGKKYLLGEKVLDPDRRLITCGADVVHLANKPFQVLLYLVDHRDRVVMRQELLEEFWDGKDVYDDTLRKAIGAIRKALGDRSDAAHYIETRHREGYRYIGPFEEAVEYAAPQFEIERTRGVRVLIEEQESQAAEKDITELVARSSILSPRQVISPVVVLVVLLSVALAIALIIDRKTSVRTKQPERPPMHSIAVLPLMNLSGDPEDEYFADGLTETFITELSKIQELKVISRSSVFTLKGKEIDPLDAGRRLDVEAILEGTVRKSGDTVRVETRLVSTEDGRVIWAGNTFDRPLKDIFSVQNEIGCSVAANLRVRLCGDERSLQAKRNLRISPLKRDTENVNVYDELLKSRYCYNKRTAEGLKKAIEYSEQAAKLDPGYAPAYAELAGDYLMGVWYIPLDPKEAVAKAKMAAAKALEIDDTYADAHEVMASVLAYEWDWSGSRNEWQRVFELNPAYTTYGYAYTLLRSNPDAAVRWIKHAQELDPLSPLIKTNVGQIMYYARRYDEAIIQLKMVLELDPDYEMAHAYLGQVYVAVGKSDEAIAEFTKAVSLSERSPELVATFGHAYAAAGKLVEATKVLHELAESSGRAYVSPYMIAHIYTGLGQKDRAFEMLEKAYHERDSHIVDLAYDPALDPLRSDWRYSDLLRRVGLSD